MLQHVDIDRIVSAAVVGTLRKRDLRRVFSEPTIDSEGQEALHVVVVLADGVSTRMNGDNAVDAIVNIQRSLASSGESRFPIIDFATEDELRHDGGH